MISGKLFAFLLVGSFILSGSSYVFAQGNMIDQRKKLMKSISSANKAIKSAVKSKDYATISAKAKDIAGKLDMYNLAKFFPQNTTSDKSRARPEIWKKWNDFMAKAYDGQQRASALADAASRMDEAKVAKAYKGYRKMCGNCQ